MKVEVKDTLEKTLPSGKILRASLCDFKTGQNLMTAVLKILKQNDFNPNSEVDSLNFIKSVFADIFSNQEITDAVFLCMSKALYDGEKVTHELFEKVEVRKDYIHIMKEIAFFNLAPFSDGLFSMFTELPELIQSMAEGNQKP